MSLVCGMIHSYVFCLQLDMIWLICDSFIWGGLAGYKFVYEWIMSHTKGRSALSKTMLDTRSIVLERAVRPLVCHMIHSHMTCLIWMWRDLFWWSSIFLTILKDRWVVGLFSQTIGLLRRRDYRALFADYRALFAYGIALFEDNRAFFSRLF